MEKGKVVTGPKVLLLINGKRVGYARSANGGETLEMQPIDALGNIETEEHVETRYRVTFSMSLVRVSGESLRKLGLQPKLGQTPLEHLRNIVAQGLLTISLTDQIDNTPLMLVEQAKFTSNSFSIDAAGFMANEVEFVAIRIGDESEAAA